MYTVFGYDSMCCDFVYVTDSFVEAVKSFIIHRDAGDVVFMRRDSYNSCSFVK